MSKALAVVDEVRGALEKMSPQFEMALPPQLPVERFTRVAMTAVQQNPDLLKADRRSLFGACMRAAQDGLLPDGKEAALVVYGKGENARVSYLPMVAGILKKIRNSGELLSLSANVVYERDEFTYELGDDERIVHRPTLGGGRGRPIAVYAIARTKDGGVYREVMSVEEVDAIRKRSRAADSGPWKTDWSEMARKTAIRRLSKRLPMSTDAEGLIRADDELYDGHQPQATEQSAEAPEPAVAAASPRGPRRLRTVINSAAEATDAGSAVVVDEPPVREPGDDTDVVIEETGEVI